MKRLLKLIVVIALVSLAALFFFGAAVLEKSTDKVIPMVKAAAENRGIQLGNVQYEDAQYGFPRTIGWRGLRADLVLEHYVALNPDARFEVFVGELDVKPSGFLLKNWNVAIRDMRVKMNVSEVFANDEFSNLDLRISNFNTVLNIEADDFRGSLKEIFGEIRTLYKTGSFEFEYSLNGEIRFELNGVPEKMGIRSFEESGRWMLVADREDMKDISSVLLEPLTDAELDLFSRFPIQAPLILYYTKYASDKSKAAYEADKSYPFDAYRHLLWSYLLTKRFGPALAERITDAHEIGATDNTEADHIMDYNNNEIGRAFVAEGVNESDIFRLATVDKRVIRFPGRKPGH